MTKPSPLQIAFGNVTNGHHVIPVHADGPRRKQPLTAHGARDASNDPEQLATWAGQYPDALYAIVCGPSKLLIVDVDGGGGKDGAGSLANARVRIPGTFGYRSLSGYGRHYAYRAPDGAVLSPSQNHRLPDGRCLRWVDIRAGWSYAIPTQVVPPVADLPAAPDWATTPAQTAPSLNARKFRGTLWTWMDMTADGAPDAAAVRIVSRRIGKQFGHGDLIADLAALVAIGAEGRPVRDAILRLRVEWLRAPWNTTAHEREFFLALEGAVQKFGRFREARHEAA